MEECVNDEPYYGKKTNQIEENETKVHDGEVYDTEFND